MSGIKNLLAFLRQTRTIIEDNISQYILERPRLDDIDEASKCEAVSERV